MADFQKHVCLKLKETSYDVVDEARVGTYPHSVIHTWIFSFFFHSHSPPQAVVDLLVMRELLWSEARSVTFSFMHNCFSSISISAGRHQQHRQDQRRKKGGERDCEAYRLRETCQSAHSIHSFVKERSEYYYFLNSSKSKEKSMYACMHSHHRLYIRYKSFVDRPTDQPTNRLSQLQSVSSQLIKTLLPLSCLSIQYETGANSRLAQFSTRHKYFPKCHTISLRYFHFTCTWHILQLSCTLP